MKTRAWLRTCRLLAAAGLSHACAGQTVANTDAGADGQEADAATDARSADVASDGDSPDAPFDGSGADVAVDGDSPDAALDGQGADGALDGQSSDADPGSIEPDPACMVPDNGETDVFVIKPEAPSGTQDWSVQVDMSAQPPPDPTLGVCTPAGAGHSEPVVVNLFWRTFRVSPVPLGKTQLSFGGKTLIVTRTE